MKKNEAARATDLALIAALAAVIAACAALPAINIPGPTPITLQTFGVLLAGALLGPVRGFLAVVLYLLVGAAGIPVFANGGSGVATLTGPTGGYLLSFPLAAAVTGLVVLVLPRSVNGKSLALAAPAIFVAGALGVAVNHFGGVIGLHGFAHLSWATSWHVDRPFWIVDGIKAVAVAVIAAAVHRAFPDLLRRTFTLTPSRSAV